MSYYEFPHTRNYDADLGYLIEVIKKLETRVEALEKKINEMEGE